MKQGNKRLTKVCMILLGLSLPALGYEKWTDPETGIQWTYNVYNGEATIGTGSANAIAISSSVMYDIAIPASLGGCPVTVISSYSFWTCGYLTSVAIPETVTTIGAEAFCYCNWLRNMTIPKNVVSIGAGTFGGCYSLRTIDFEGMPPTGLKDASINKNITAIRYNVAFADEWLPVIEECGFTSATSYVPNPTIADLTAQQRYPWNGKVDIGFNLSDAEVENRTLIVWAIDRGASMTNLAQHVTGDIGYTNGAHHIVWDMAADGLSTVSTDVIIGVAFRNECQKAAEYALISETTKWSNPATINLIDGVRTVTATELLTYSTSWTDGASDVATAIVEVNGAAISEECGRGIIEWTPQYNGVFVLTHKVMDGGVQIGEALTAAFQVDHWKADTPVIEPAATLFPTVSQEVTLSCDTEDATIYYTIDGSEPSATNGRVYKGPFDIYQTTTVKAIAVKDDWKDSAVASATFTKANAIGPAINMLEVLPDNDKTHPWMVVSDVTHDGVSAVKSGAIEDEESTTLKVVVYGAGQLSFWWKTSCEPSIDGEYYDYATFYNGSTAVTNLAGVTDWQQVWLNVSGTGKHTFKWTYQKDDSGSTVPDGVWLDQVQWLPATTDYYSDHTLTTETPVKYNWLRQYGLSVTTDFESAAKAKSGKRDGAGRELTVEQEYIAGTDPTNETSHLTSSIEMVDGFPVIMWKPDLNEGGAKAEREYKIWGSSNLEDGGEWEWPTNALHRFFKVTVEMP